jgi:hypothetical protein
VVFYVNEMKCLSNAVLQSCLRQNVMALWGVPPCVRHIVEQNCLNLRDIAQVTLHACPQEQGSVKYTVEVMTRDMKSCHETYELPDHGAAHATYVVYDRNRDGVVEHLHLVH